MAATPPSKVDKAMRPARGRSPSTARRYADLAPSTLPSGDVEIAVAEYIDWFNQRRLHGELGHVPPAEFEALHATTTVPKAPLKTR
jgi:transposase InsO family protein